MLTRRVQRRLLKVCETESNHHLIGIKDKVIVMEFYSISKKLVQYCRLKIQYWKKQLPAETQI